MYQTIQWHNEHFRVLYQWIADNCFLWIKNDILHYMNPPDEEWKTIISFFNVFNGFINYSHTHTIKLSRSNLLMLRGNFFFHFYIEWPLHCWWWYVWGINPQSKRILLVMSHMRLTSVFLSWNKDMWY